MMFSSITFIYSVFFIISTYFIVGVHYRPEKHFGFIGHSENDENQKAFYAFSETQTESQVGSFVIF